MIPELHKGYISKRDKNSAEYDALYLQGIELLQELASAHWTDYNEHDPGVTILENLAYTFTNLTYKANLPIEDLLRESKGADLESGDNAFFEAAEIYTTNPVTVDDYRKLFIDRIENVKNVWIRFQEAPGSGDQNLNSVKGLYQIYVELSRYSSNSDTLEKDQKEVKDKIKAIYNAHRNLCEDIGSITVYEPWRLHMKLMLTLSDFLNGEEILAKAFFELNDYISHEVRVFSLWQLKENGDRIDDIYEGPKPENGFIPDDELRDRKSRVLISDLTRIISQIDGIVSVNSFELSYEKQDGDQTEIIRVEGDVLEIPENFAPFIVLPSSGKDLQYMNNGVTFTPDIKELQRQLSYVESMNLGSFKAVSSQVNTIPIPQGTDRAARDYYSIREQFPTIYGLGEYGLPSTADKKRLGQLNQLKGYLLPFDQVLANFLSQLTNIFALYDVNTDKMWSYFTQELEDMKDLVHLVQNEDQTETEALEQWSRTLENLMHRYDDASLERLNQVSNNLLARFAEQFPTYALRKINSSSYGKRLTGRSFDKALLRAKRKMISSYDTLSYNRMRGYDHGESLNVDADGTVTGSDMDSLPGLVQKVGILMGINDYSIRSLSQVVADAGIRIYRRGDNMEEITEKLEVVYTRDEIDVISVDDIVIIDEVVENLRDAYYFAGYSGAILEDVLREGVISDNYEIRSTDSKRNNTSYLLFAPEDENPTVVHLTDSVAQARVAIDYAVNFFIRLNKKSEGMFLLEHLLLAPPFSGEHYGYTFTLPVSETRTLEFQQFGRYPTVKRNENATLLSENLTAEGLDTERIQLQVVSIRNNYEIQILDYNALPLAITQQEYRDKQTAESEMRLLLEEIKKFSAGDIDENITYYAYFEDEREEESFFSFKMSFILPSWPVRFQNENFRTQFNNTVYENSPAHIVFGTFWLDLEGMTSFEKVYFNWLRTMSSEGSETARIRASYDVIQNLKGHLNNVDQ